MQPYIVLSLVIAFWLSSLASADSMHEALQDKYTAECSELANCDAVLRFGEAFECSEGKCKCHPDATLDERNKTCSCNPGFQKFGNKCLSIPPAIPPPNPEDPVEGSGRAFAPASGPTCVRDSDCQEYQICQSKSCVCQENYTLANGACRKAARLVGDDCEYDEQCKHFLGARSLCRMSRCVCDEGNIPTSNRSACMLLKGLLEPCTYSEQCQTNHSSCVTNVCMCLPNYVNDESRACLPIVHAHEDHCSIPQQCHMGNLGPGSHCAKTGPDEGRCICMSSYHYNKNRKRCLSTVGYGEQCDDVNTGCYLPLDGDNQGIECKKNKCQCKKKYIISEDKQHCSSALILQSSIFFILVSAVLPRRW